MYRPPAVPERRRPSSPRTSNERHDERRTPPHLRPQALSRERIGTDGNRRPYPWAVGPRQERAIIALLNEPTVKKAAESAEVAESTMHRWLDEPAFAAAYRKAQRKVFAQAVSLCQKYSGLAVQCLAKIIGDASAPHSAKVAASQAMLKFGRESIEFDDMLARLAAIEATQPEKGKQRW